MIASRSTLKRPLSRSIVSTVSRSRPENERGWRTSSQATTERRNVRPETRLRSVVRGTKRRRPVFGIAAGATGLRRGGDDDARGAAVQAGVDELAVERHRAADRHRGRVRDVDLGQDDGRAAVRDAARRVDRDAGRRRRRTSS